MSTVGNLYTLLRPEEKGTGMEEHAKEFWKSKRLWVAILTPLVAFAVAWVNGKLGTDITGDAVMASFVVPALGYILGRSFEDAKVRSADVLGEAAKSGE